MSDLLIEYSPIREMWALIGSTGKVIYESYILSDVKRFREEFLNQEEQDDGA